MKKVLIVAASIAAMTLAGCGMLQDLLNTDGPVSLKGLGETQYVEFNQRGLDLEVSQGDDVVLFFYHYGTGEAELQSREMDQNFYNERGNLGSSITLMRVNMEVKGDVSNAFNVELPGTVILLDEDGEERARSTELLTISDVVGFTSQ